MHFILVECNTVKMEYSCLIVPFSLFVTSMSCLLQGWTNLTCEGMFPKSNMLLVMLMDEMAKSAELKSEEELKVNNSSKRICEIEFIILNSFYIKSE